MDIDLLTANMIKKMLSIISTTTTNNNVIDVRLLHSCTGLKRASIKGVFIFRTSLHLISLVQTS